MDTAKIPRPRRNLQEVLSDIDDGYSYVCLFNDNDILVLCTGIRTSNRRIHGILVRGYGCMNSNWLRNELSQTAQITNTTLSGQSAKLVSMFHDCFEGQISLV
jgi:hypothetical protein